MLDAFEILWPTTCAGCDTPAEGRICKACRATLVPETLPTPIDCVRGGFAASAYTSPPARILRRAKYGADPGLMRLLGRAFASSILAKAEEVAADVIVPAPSAWVRRLRRGFSPAAVLADPIARGTGVPLLHALAIGPGPRQAGLRAASRDANARRRVRLAVKTVPPRVLLVDDVVTTGATAAACATELLGGGAREVWLVALAVALPEDGLRVAGRPFGDGLGQGVGNRDSSELTRRPRGP